MSSITALVVFCWAEFKHLVYRTQCMALKIFWTILILLSLVSLTLVIFVELATREFAQPKRRPLQDYHFDWLDAPENHGVHIKKAAFLNDQVPCLIIEPAGSPAKRGNILRQQIAERNLPLPEFGAITKQMVILHGRSGRKEDLLPVAERFCAVGYRCLLPDMPGHGDSKIDTVNYGATDFDQTMINRLVVEAIEQQLFDDSLPCALLGISMGGSLAISNASNDQQSLYSAITIICSFDNLEAVIRHQCHSRLGKPLGNAFHAIVTRNAHRKTGLQVQNSHPRKWAESITIPALIIHGDADEMIPIAHGEQLYQAFPSADKKWLTVTDASHSNILITPMPVFAEIVEFFTEHL